MIIGCETIMGQENNIKNIIKYTTSLGDVLTYTLNDVDYILTLFNNNPIVKEFNGIIDFDIINQENVEESDKSIKYVTFLAIKGVADNNIVSKIKR